MQGINIKTKSAVIGVKGTTFLVDVRGKNIIVFLKEGELDIKSIKGQFKRYQKKQMSEFKAYKQKQQEEFAKFVKSFR